MIIASQRTIFGDGTGTDGRALTDADLNAISTNMTRRAWEVPGYADLIAFDMFGAADYEGVLAGTYGDSYARLRGVFTKGGGLKPYQAPALSSRAGGGFLGIWNQTAPITAPAAAGVPNMLWAYINGADGVSHDAAAAGNRRWDLVTCTLVESNAATVARHFKDAVTGAVTSEVVVPGKSMTFTVGLTKGAESASAPALPSIPTGQHVLYAVLVVDSAIAEVVDCTIPLGSLKHVVVPASAGICQGVADHGSGAGQVIPWAVGAYGSVTSGAVGTDNPIFLLPPLGWAGDGNVRVLGCEIAYKLLGTTEVDIGVLSTYSGPFVALDNLHGFMTRDGAEHTTSFDFRAFPQAATLGPYWANGGRTKGGAANGQTLAIRVKSVGTGGDVIRAVQWSMVGG